MPVKDLFENRENTNNTAILLISIYDSPEKEKECIDSIAELQSLAETSLPDKDCEASFFCVTQCRNAPDSASYIGYGKAKEADVYKRQLPDLMKSARHTAEEFPNSLQLWLKRMQPLRFLLLQDVYKRQILTGA